MTENMTAKTTIWESANRPLFLRSVWLRAANASRGVHQRHYILDYEPRQERQVKSKDLTEKISQKPPSNYSTSSLELSDFDPTSDSSEDLFLLGSAKVKYEQQSAQLQRQRRSRQTARSHSQNSKTLELQTAQKRNDSDFFPEVLSRRSSLQDFTHSHNCCSNPDERLAERVLNWLDLAGKTSQYLQVFETTNSSDMESGNAAVKTPRIGQPRATQSAATLKMPQRASSSLKKNAQSGSASQQNHRAESIKHITIIFNKEGVPVRLNRPARNIDLCAVTSSPSTVRRLTGSMASARLYEGDSSAGGYASSRRILAATSNTNNNVVTSATALGSSRKQRDFDGSARSSMQRFFDDAGASNVQDSKKQLHIFMPSLPKKGLLNGGISLGEDVISVLSNSISELGKN